ncbi:prepilin-type N-terminal cleavage/methylation domain-containing protein [Motiliproteus coralliicola]|uniref:Type II secretion system protein H n=1 Tax=Motiliproteus coralliicola TaxID=2283196 RepID=A0A369WGA7_9GAMM|nr:GspH/FimT family pseudopilin [Motiliproteus coralliicola]RDE18495.1 prepilin-type N-terminal cleavage/methylation domain-containing protein [Motiliproteus coralliicola]
MRWNSGQATQTLPKRSQTRTQRSGGFTLIELLVVLAIVAVLLTIATPNFDSVISGSRVDEARLSVATSLATARTEAIKRGERVRMCVGTSGSCDTTDSGIEDWSGGWQVQISSSSEAIQINARSDNNTVVNYNCGNVIEFDNSGERTTSSGISPCTFSITSDGTTSSLYINQTGRVRMQ